MSGSRPLRREGFPDDATTAWVAAELPRGSLIGTQGRPELLRTGRSEGDNARMPRICAFYGIVVTMYWRDHPPPHFHASYAGQVAKIEIESIEVLEGWLPPRALRLVTEWAGVHQDELRGNWDRARAHEPLLPIDPLP